MYWESVTRNGSTVSGLAPGAGFARVKTRVIKKDQDND